MGHVQIYNKRKGKIVATHPKYHCSLSHFFKCTDSWLEAGIKGHRTTLYVLGGPFLVQLIKTQDHLMNVQVLEVYFLRTFLCTQSTALLITDTLHISRSFI